MPPTWATRQRTHCPMLWQTCWKWLEVSPSRRHSSARGAARSAPAPITADALPGWWPPRAPGSRPEPHWRARALAGFDIFHEIDPRHPIVPAKTAWHRSVTAARRASRARRPRRVGNAFSCPVGVVVIPARPSPVEFTPVRSSFPAGADAGRDTGSHRSFPHRRDHPGRWPPRATGRAAAVHAPFQRVDNPAVANTVGQPLA